MPLMVNEIFHSIQGESVNSGRPCAFIRLTGCNLRCTYCDTTYAYEEGKVIKISEIIDEIAVYQCPLVEVTGGEPLFQKETPELIYRLLENGYEVMMETNGSLDISSVDDRCMKIVDIKCPGSEMSEKNDLENLKRLRPTDQVKFVIGNREDYLFAKGFVDSELNGFPGSHILFSPVYGIMPPDKLVKWILDDHLNVRLNLQIHKMIWPLEQRGV
ncbi:radical SAM protein [Thermodesulfobacteriota bacterium]